MIEEKITYSLECDDKDCNNIFDGNEGQWKVSVIECAEYENWMVKGQKCYCPDHRPGVEREEIE